MNMASLSHLPLCSISYFLLFFFITSASAITSDEKVKLGIYYESLSPSCCSFMVNNLSEIFKNELIDIIDLHLVPYGNAKLSANNTIICQHGEDECFLNTMEACAINIWPDVNVYYPLLRCVESLVIEGNYDWRSCFQKMGLDDHPIDECYVTGNGTQLQLQYGKETDNLNPPHEYVPWVIVNNTPLKERYSEFMSFVCEEYKGNTVPEVCKHILHSHVRLPVETTSSAAAPPLA